MLFIIDIMLPKNDHTIVFHIKTIVIPIPIRGKRDNMWRHGIV